MHRVGIHQPNYAPWLGYFAKMASVDTFVFLDDCQMPIGRSYVSRVQVRGREGAEWMSLPVQRISGEPINSVQFADGTWPKKHLMRLQVNYGRCPYFDSVMELIRPLYENPGTAVADFNIRLITVLAGYLGLSARFVRASDLAIQGAGTARLIDIVKTLQGTTYVSGLGGNNYQDPDAFRAAGVELDLRAYKPIPYTQVQGGFVPGLSALDALFHLGPGIRALFEYPKLDHSAHTTVGASVFTGPRVSDGCIGQGGTQDGSA